MNCKPGEMAVVIRPSVLTHNSEDRDAVKAGTTVVVKEPMGTTPESWILEEPIRFEVKFSCGCKYSGRVLDYFDCSLRPIRPQADDAVDEMVRIAGAAPKTITEVREVAR